MTSHHAMNDLTFSNPHIPDLDVSVLNMELCEEVKKVANSSEIEDYIKNSTNGLKAVQAYLNNEFVTEYTMDELFIVYAAAQPTAPLKNIVVQSAGVIPRLVITQEVPMHLQKCIGTFLYYRSISIKFLT